MGGRLTLLNPSGSTSATTPTFTWTPVAGAASYDVFVTRTDVLTAGIINQTGLVGTSFTPAAPLPIGTYRAWVRAISTTAEVGPWSLQVNFSIAVETSEPGSGSENLLRVQLAGLNNNSLNCDQLSSPVEAVDDVVSQETLSVPGDMSITPNEPASIHSTAMPVVPLNPTVRTELIRSVLFLAEDAVCVDAVMADLKMLPTLLEIY